MLHDRAALLLTLALVLASLPALAVTIEVVVVDGPGEGFNDATPATPVGGNTGTTIGQQRLILFQTAASQWGEMLGNLGPSPVIQVNAQFDPQACSPTSGVLGAAGALWVGHDFTNNPLPNTWYPGALVNALVGGDDYTDLSEIDTTFNSNVDSDPNCLGGVGWYYGLDGNPGNKIHLYPVLLHELAHGLGFQTFVDKGSGVWCCAGSQLPDAYGRLIYDVSSGQQWPDMTNAGRATSAVNPDNVVFTGATVNAYSPPLLDAQNLIRVTAGPAAGDYLGLAAGFGGAITETGVSGNLELVNDGSLSPTLGCNPLVGFTAENIALIDRGTCEFGVKCLNAQNAGALGCVVGNNGPGIETMGGGAVGGSVFIPAMMISQADRNTVVAGGLPVASILRKDAAVGRQGLHPTDGRILLHTPIPLESGSSVSHFTYAATPNLLMEPSASYDLWKDPDLTIYELQDIGWPSKHIFHDGFDWGDTRRWSSQMP